MDDMAQLFAVFQATVLDNPYIPQRPTPKQAEFLVSSQREVFFGGSAGPGKSSALLMAGLQYAHEPTYSALLLRRTYADLALPGAIMDRSHEWLRGTDAKWKDKDKTWIFPSGATLTFGFLDNENDKYRYQGAEFCFVGFDELTQFSESMYRYLFSRLRRPKGSNIPIRMRAAANPGGIGHEWVKQRFITEGASKGRLFIPARIDDNPHLDADEYKASLMELDPTTRAQLLAGDWDARPPGNKFKREWFEVVDPEDVPHDMRVVRFWDMAATEEPKRKGKVTDPDWTAGCKMGEKDGIFYVFDVRRTRKSPQGVEWFVTQTAHEDGRQVEVYMEQEPGSSGVHMIDHYRRRVLLGYTFRGVKSTGNKEVRANPVSSMAEAGCIKLVRGAWIGEFLDEVELFPQEGVHDDMVDSLSGSFSALTRGRSHLIEAKPRKTAEVVNITDYDAPTVTGTIQVQAEIEKYLPTPILREKKPRASDMCPQCNSRYTMVRGASRYCPTHGWQGNTGVPQEYVQRG